jgi:hypothetical protein
MRMTHSSSDKKLKKLVPPIFVEGYKKFSVRELHIVGIGKLGRCGRSVDGHDAEEVLQKVCTATFKVVRKRQYASKTLFCLPALQFSHIVVPLRAAQKNQGSLTVPDSVRELGNS